MRALAPPAAPEALPGTPQLSSAPAEAAQQLPGALQDRIHSLAAAHRHASPPQAGSGGERFATITFAVGGAHSPFRPRFWAQGTGDSGLRNWSSLGERLLEIMI